MRFALARLLRAVADRLDPCDAHLIEALGKAGLFPPPRPMRFVPRRQIRPGAARQAVSR